MKHIIITTPFSSYDDFKEFARLMEPGVEYDLQNGFRYKAAYIRSERDGYTWGLKERGRWIYPEKEGLIANFKLVAGAKKSLIKHVEFIFIPNY